MMYKDVLLKRYGLGYSSVKYIFNKFGLSFMVKNSDVSSRKIFKIESYLNENFILDDELKYSNNAVLKKLVDNKSYKGRRLVSGLPVRGQRTKSNGHTQKKRPFKKD
jgi:small subunit ribosomal protein S13